MVQFSSQWKEHEYLHLYMTEVNAVTPPTSFFSLCSVILIVLIISLELVRIMKCINLVDLSTF